MTITVTFELLGSSGEHITNISFNAPNVGKAWVMIGGYIHDENLDPTEVVLVESITQ